MTRWSPNRRFAVALAAVVALVWVVRRLGLDVHAFSHWFNLVFGVLAAGRALWLYFRQPRRPLAAAMYGFWSLWTLLMFCQDFLTPGSIAFDIVFDASIAAIVGVIVMMHYMNPDQYKK